MRAFDFSNNEMARLHIRHMVGGHAPHADHELLYRFEFPERPGALLDFLTSMSHTWNISLFHYRNHGTDSPEDMTIPWLLAGPGVRVGHALQTPISLLDTAPTLARRSRTDSLRHAAGRWSGRMATK